MMLKSHFIRDTVSAAKRRQGIRIVYDLAGYIPLDELTKQETA